MFGFKTLCKFSRYNTTCKAHFVLQTRIKCRLKYSTATENKVAELDFENKGPLAGVQILDLSRVLAGPYCSQILGDYGADVTKVEIPGLGDDTRYLRTSGEGRFWKEKTGISCYFGVCNRNKRAMTLNFKHEKGKEILFDLVRKADIV